MSPRISTLLGFVSLILLSGCTPARDPFAGVKPGQIKVLTSFPPLYCFAANIAGGHAKVLCFLSTTGPHGFQATALDSIKVAKADIFLVNGLGLDDFVTKLASDARARKSVVFPVAEKLPHSKLIGFGEGETPHVHADGTVCTHGEHDPHVWLGPEHAQLMVKVIAAKLSELRPEHKTAFDDRTAAYTKQLQELHEYGLEKFKGKKNRRVIVTHDFLRYFAQGYQLDIAGSIQPKAGQEADAGELARLAKVCKEQDVHVIIVEPQYSKGAAESLQQHLASQGLTVRLAEIDPLETASADEDGNPDPGLYLRRMRENIDNLARALP
jgi:zinc transport system substrate-binding protein